MNTLAVGCGAGFSGDRVDAAAPVVRTLIERGGPAALIFENLAERTLATQHLAKRANPELGYEPLLYELHDPAAYITPDVVADITDAVVAQVGPDQVRLSGVRGHPRTATLKANVFFDGGWFGEGEISYAGPNAEARARLAMGVLQKRMGPHLSLRFDLIGVSSILGDDGNRLLGAAPISLSTDIRLRVAGQHLDIKVIDQLLREVTALWTGGPAGGGGVRVAKRQRLSTQSCLIARERVPASFSFAA